MARPGAGGSSGRSSGSGHSVSRGGSGHRVGGNSRPGASRPSGGSSSGRSAFNTGMNVYRQISRGHGYGTHRHYSYGYGGHRTVYNNTTVVNTTFGSYVMAKVLSTVIILAVLLLVGTIGVGTKIKSETSTIQRTKIETGNAYINDNIIDELGWLDNRSKVSTHLKGFYDETGVTPFIYLKAYDSSLQSDRDKEEWAMNYYDTTFDREDILLYVYFEEANSNDVGYSYLAYGTQAGQIMDAEAQDIFWRYFDSAWTTYDANDTDDMFVYVFNKTGSTIMRVSTTSKDIIKWVLIVGVVLILVVGGIIFFTRWASYKKMKAESDERILRTPVKDLADDVHNPTADLEDKYLH